MNTAQKPSISTSEVKGGIKTNNPPDYKGYGQDFDLYQLQVANFKKPHGVKLESGVQLAIRFLVSPYNCAVKLCGRLTPHAFNEKGEPLTYIDEPLIKLFQENKDAILGEFNQWVESRPFPALSVNNPFFPSDTGNYGVNQFIYADDVLKENQGSWFNSFPRLITELEKYGWKVHTGPEFYNCTYNTPGSGHYDKESRIYVLTPPGMVVFLKNPK